MNPRNLGRISVSVLFGAAVSASLAAREIAVSDPLDLAKAAIDLKPGDTLVLAPGTWHDLDINLAGAGTPEAPIVFSGSPNGATLLTGRTHLGLSGTHLEVRNLHFFKAEPPDGSDSLVSFRHADKSASDSRLTGVFFDACNPADQDRRYAWVRLYGLKNRVDHCLFSGQTHSGVTVQVMMNVPEAGHRIDHNHFLDRAPGSGNGFECIQVGQSRDSMKIGRVQVDSNLFENCDGETEIVSSKTCENVIRRNLFYRSFGTLTLRHGDDCLVEDNVFIGDGKKGAGGIRIIGSGHTVRGNYFEGLSSYTGGVIVLYSGKPDSPLSGYFAADRARIERNLFYGIEGVTLYLIGGYAGKDRFILPTGVMVRGNLLHQKDGRFVQVAGQLEDAVFEENILVAPTETGRTDLTGFALKSLRFERNDDGLVVPSGPGSEALPHPPALLRRREVGPDWTMGTPEMVVLDPTQLLTATRSEGTAASELAAEEVLKADLILDAGTLYSVTANQRVPPSGDIRDYYSTGPYWWRNPDTENGLPYVRIDGKFNPERDRVSDRTPFHAMIADTWTLAIAFVTTGDERYAQFARKLLHNWFLDEKNGMRPNLRHAQAIPGRTDGRGTGIIDALVLVELTDAIRMLEFSFSWPHSERASLKRWFEEYLEWLTYHPNGIDERSSENNHGTAYDLQQLAIADFLGKKFMVHDILKRVAEIRISTQITPEGTQPLELARTRSWSYCTENLEHFSRIAAIARKYDFDLFGYTSDQGSSVKGALDALIPHACHPQETWKNEQVTEWQTEYLYASLSIAAGLMPREGYDRYLDCMKPPHDALLSILMRPSQPIGR
jgi:hypothetical protein